MARVFIPTELRRLVANRAQGRGEYCLVHQDDTETSHHVDHLVAIKHGGATASHNLALACQLCNHYKGSDLTAIDPESGETTPLFNPRTQVWTEHFRLVGAYIDGLSATGRATIQLLRMNDEARLIDRRALLEAGRYAAIE